MGINSKQYGELFELRIIDILIEKSNGEISCFRNLIDDNGIDLIVIKKNSFSPIFLQIKGRKKLDKNKRFTQVINYNTFNENNKLFFIFCYFPNRDKSIFWLVPSQEIKNNLNVHTPQNTYKQFNISFSINTTSNIWNKFKVMF